VLRPDAGLELDDLLTLNVEVPLEIAAHLSLHLVDLFEREHLLRDDTPRLVRVGVVTDDLGGYHEGGDKEAVPRGTAGGGEPSL
jgi:hypothetical protein